MGLITKLVGGLVAFLGGILGFFGKLLGFNKSEYFLEMDDAAGASTPAIPATEEKPVALAASSVAPVQQASANGKAEAPAAIVAAPAPVAELPAKTKAKKAKAASASNGAAPEVEPAPAAVAVAPPVSEMTFAPTYLTAPSSNNGRRRPGPNMDYFKDMAKKVKTN